MKGEQKKSRRGGTQSGAKCYQRTPDRGVMQKESRRGDTQSGAKCYQRTPDRGVMFCHRDCIVALFVGAVHT